MTRELRTLEQFMTDDYLQSPANAANYLATALEMYEEDNNMEAFLIALKRVIEAKGGISELSRKTGLNRQNLHKILNNKVVPKFSTLSLILQNLGFKLTLKAS